MSSAAIWAAQLLATPHHPTDRTYPIHPDTVTTGGVPTMPLTDRQRAARDAVASFDDRPPHHILSRNEAEQLHAARLEQSRANSEAAAQRPAGGAT